MNNDYDREDPVSLSEGSVSLSKASVGMCQVCGVYKVPVGPSGGSWEGVRVCPPCYARYGVPKNLAKISEGTNAGG
jgi:hypothetical protein